MEVLIFITMFAVVFGIFYLFFTTRNKERLALIEKGADASLFNTGKAIEGGAAVRRVFGVLKVGLFLIGIGLGIAMGYFVSTLGMEEGASYPSMIFLFGGLGLLVYYLISKKKVDQ